MRVERFALLMRLSSKLRHGTSTLLILHYNFTEAHRGRPFPSTNCSYTFIRSGGCHSVYLCLSFEVYFTTEAGTLRVKVKFNETSVTGVKIQKLNARRVTNLI